MNTTRYYDRTIKVDNIFTPQQGIDVVWKKYQAEQYATLIGRNKTEINEQLNKLKIIQDRIRDYHTYHKTVPPKPLKVEW